MGRLLSRAGVPHQPRPIQGTTVRNTVTFGTPRVLYKGGHSGFIFTASALARVHLSGLGITSIAPEGLNASCFGVPNPDEGYVVSLGTDSNDHHLPRWLRTDNSPQGIDLSYNELSEPPPLGCLGRSIYLLELGNNNIEQIPSRYFADFQGPLLTFFVHNNTDLDMDEDVFSGVENSAFALVLSASYCRVTQLPNLNQFNGSSLTVGVQQNRVALNGGVIPAFIFNLVGMWYQPHVLQFVQLNLRGTGIHTISDSAFVRVPSESEKVGSFSSLFLDLSDNPIAYDAGGFPQSGILNNTYAKDIHLVLQNTSLRTLSASHPIFQGLPSTSLTIDLSNNPLSAIEPGAFTWNAGAGCNGNIELKLDNLHNLTTLPDHIFSGMALSTLEVSLSHTNLSEVGRLYDGATIENSATLELPGSSLNSTSLGSIISSFSQSTGDLFLVCAQNNIERLPPNFISRFASRSGTRNQILSLDLSHNPITAVAEDAFQGQGYPSELHLDISWSTAPHGIQHWPLNLSFPEAGIGKFLSLLEVTASGSNLSTFAFNSILDGVNRLGSAAQSSGQLQTVDLKLDRNAIDNITRLQEVGPNLQAKTVSMHLNLSYNRISGSLPAGAVAFIGTCDLSYNQLTVIQPGVFINMPLVQNNLIAPNASHTFAINSGSTFLNGSNATENFESTERIDRTNFAILKRIEESCWSALIGSSGAYIQNTSGSWCIDTWDAIASGSRRFSALSVVNLSSNLITRVSPIAFGYSESLKHLDLSNNSIAIIPPELVLSIPLVESFIVSHNRLWAIPRASTKLFKPEWASSNPISCTVYTPIAVQCTCIGQDRPYFSYACDGQWARCLQHPGSGCENGTFAWDLACNEIGFSGKGPQPQCKDSCRNGEYHDNATKRCTPLTVCSEQFPNTPSYAYSQPTNFSDRKCSVCSSCPAGFDEIPCTANKNTQCTRSTRLSSGDIAALSLGIFIMLALGGLGATFAYKRVQSRATAIKHNLVLTEQLLGTERELKVQMEKEKDLMEQAWQISEGDLTYKEVIGEGAFGRVFSGSWGHISVAIKVLKFPIDELDQSSVDDFNREVKFMQSIRHPHLLTFYGAGVSRDYRAFLVTELMERGSLRSLLLMPEKEQPLSWSIRVTFATDVARGMAYLHKRGTLHRDLKADNCFVNDRLRVKVADFGTGWLTWRIDGKQHTGTSDLSAHTLNDEAKSTTQRFSRSISNGHGSLLWMSPEALRGGRLSENTARACDVYSFAIVLFEIWSRAKPWDEITAQESQFYLELRRKVTHGIRPALPPHVGNAPPGYKELMQLCWSSMAVLRPPFTKILPALESIETHQTRSASTVGESTF